MRIVAALMLATSLVVAGPSLGATRVDLELVLAVDVSDSMTADEQALQRRGYINALSHADVTRAIGSGAHGSIALTYVEWAAPGRHRIIVPWTLVDGPASAAAFALRLEGKPDVRLEGTSISSALGFSARLFRSNGFLGDRLVIDVSGDGPNNMGMPVPGVRDRIAARGITINGLPIVLHRSDFRMPDIEAYYRDCVVGGPGAFLISVDGAEALEAAIRRKLTLEIAGGRRPLSFASTLALPQGDCLIGERMGGRAK